MDELDIFNVLRGRVWMILSLALVAMLAGYAGSFLYPDRYTATALVLVRPQEPIKMDTRSISKEFLDFTIGAANVETPNKTYIEIIKSPALIGQLVRKLGLDKPEPPKKGFLSKLVPDFLRPAIDSFKAALQDTISFVMYGAIIPNDPFASAVKVVQDNLDLESRAETYTFTIKYTAKTPQLAAEVANGTAKLFVDYMDQLRQSESRYGSDRLRAEFTKSKQEIAAAGEQLKAFKNAHRIFKYESEYDENLKVITGLQTELGKLNETAAGLAAVANQNSLSTTTVSLTAKRENILNQIRDWEAQLKRLPELELDLRKLELGQKIAMAGYDTVSKQFQEAQMKDALASREVQLAAEAVPPHLPVGPTRMIYALVALLSGLVAGVGLAFLLEYFNRTVLSIRHVEDFVGVRVLATIPRIPILALAYYRAGTEIAPRVS